MVGKYFCNMFIDCRYFHFIKRRKHLLREPNVLVFITHFDALRIIACRSDVCQVFGSGGAIVLSSLCSQSCAPECPFSSATTKVIRPPAAAPAATATQSGNHKEHGLPINAGRPFPGGLPFAGAKTTLCSRRLRATGSVMDHSCSAFGIRRIDPLAELLFLQTYLRMS